MADKDKADAAAPEPKSGLKKLAMPVGIALALVAAMLGGLSATGIVSFGGAAEAPAAGEAAAEPVKPAGGPAFYASLQPPMVINFNDGNERHFVKVAIDIMSHEQRTIEAFKQHDAVIRNNLLLMFQEMDFEAANTREGIADLQRMAEKEIEDILEPYVRSRDVEGVYFTTFILQ